MFMSLLSPPLILSPQIPTLFQIHGLLFFMYYCDIYMYLSLSIERTEFIQCFLYVFRADLLELNN